MWSDKFIHGLFSKKETNLIKAILTTIWDINKL